MNELERMNSELNGTKIQRLSRLNKGFNFANINRELRKYKVEVMLSVSMNFEENRAVLIVRHNLDGINRYSYSSDCYKYGGVVLAEFLCMLSDHASTIYYIPRSYNRKNLAQFNDISFRDNIINFADINFVIHEQAKKMLDRLKVDFVHEVEEALKQQREATSFEIKAADRFIYLKEKISELKELANKRVRYEYSNYRDDEDRSIQLKIGRTEYNKRLKEIEKEMKDISKRYDFIKFNKQLFDYFEEPMSYIKYLKENKEELKQFYDENYSGEDTESYDDYCNQQYENYVEGLN